MRLIDADALKESLEIWEDCDELFVGNIRKHIDDAPTIKLERKQGKWIYNSPVTMKCDQCEFVIKDWDWNRFNFCPNCGAEMREGGKDGSI